MYIHNGAPFDINQAHTIEDVQYPVPWFHDLDNRAAHGIEELHYIPSPAVDSSQKFLEAGYERDHDGRWVNRWIVVDKTAEELAAEAAAADGELAALKVSKNQQINAWRAAANLSTFQHAGKLIACDELSRSDIDGVANHIALLGAFPEGFPGGWKATDNTMIPLPDVDAFRAMFASMTARGTENFNHSQSLKAALAMASTPEEVAAIQW